MNNPAFRKLYNEILEKKLKAYAVTLEAELNSIPNVVKGLDIGNTVASAATSMIPTGGILESVHRGNSLLDKLKGLGDVAKKGVKGLGIAAAMSGVLSAGFLGHVNSPVLSELGGRIYNSLQNSSKIEVNQDKIASNWLQKTLNEQNIVDPVLRKKAEESQRLLRHEFEGYSPGSFTNLAHPDTPIYKGIEAVGPQSGYNVFGAHGIFNMGIRKGATEEEALKYNIKKGEILSASLIAETIKNSAGYNPNYPLKLLNCEIGKAHIAQEISDILGVKVLAATENVWLGPKGGALAVAKTGADGKTADLSQVGEVLEFTPRSKESRGSLSNYYRKNTVGYAGNRQRSSEIENLVQAPKEFFENKSAEDLYNTFTEEAYYNPNLPLRIIAPFADKRVLQDLSEMTRQPVISYAKGAKIMYDNFGFSGAIKSSGHPDRGTTYYPSKYRPRTDVQLNTKTNTPWVEYVETQLGVKESGMSTNDLLEGNNRAPEIDTFLKASGVGAGYAWCASILEWSMQKSGVQSAGKYAALAKTWGGYGQKLTEPAFGSIASYKEGVPGSHAGLVVGRVKDDPSKIILLGGNQGDTVNYIVKDTSSFNFNYPKDYTPDYSIPTYDREKLGYNNTTTAFSYLPKRAIVK